MKTQIFYSKMEIKVVGMLMVLSLVFLISLNAQELPCQPILKGFTKTLDNSPGALVHDNFAGDDNSAYNETVNKDILPELKLWMNKGSYWESGAEDKNSVNNDLPSLSEYMKQGHYWKDSGIDELAMTDKNPVVNVENEDE